MFIPDSCKVLFEDTLREIERELYLFRDEIVRVHALSCDERLLNCSKNNYNECNSVFPDKQCVCGNVILKDQMCDGKSQELSAETFVCASFPPEVQLKRQTNPLSHLSHSTVGNIISHSCTNPRSRSSL